MPTWIDSDEKICGCENKMPDNTVCPACERRTRILGHHIHWQGRVWHLDCAQKACIARLEEERLLLIYWLLRSYQALRRDGWEEGPSTEETAHSLVHVLANFGHEPNESKEAQELLKQPAIYFIS